MKKFLLVAVIVIFCSAYLVLHLRKSVHPEHSKILTVNVIRAEKTSSYHKMHAYLGQMEPVKTSNLGFEMGGTVKGVFVEEGSYVTKGQTLAILDMDRLVAKRDEVEAESKRVGALAELSGLTKDRTIAASEFRGVSEVDRDEAEKTHAAHLAFHQASEARLEQVDVEIGKAHIFAPYSGYIAKRYLDEGSVVGAGSPVLQIVDINTVEARIGISALHALSVGDNVVVESCGQSYPAEVTAILPVRDLATRNREIVCSISNELKTIVPGDPAVLKLEKTVDQEGIWLPISALTESSRGLWVCYVVQENLKNKGVYGLFTQELEIIDQTTERAYVRGPLRDGDFVVSDGLNRVIPGLSVYIKKGF
ncbi:MAG: efflux RND transporter periplasmic adaptor subunit [Chlamydiota bacterium]|nr:efflux RND transporter periplasmic adaptor subunit [Chlamydiota bacterium]